MKIAVILENTGGELDRKELEIDTSPESYDDVHAAIEGVIERWLLNVGDTIRIVEAKP